MHVQGMRAWVDALLGPVLALAQGCSWDTMRDWSLADNGGLVRLRLGLRHAVIAGDAASLKRIFQVVAQMVCSIQLILCVRLHATLVEWTTSAGCRSCATLVPAHLPPSAWGCGPSCVQQPSWPTHHSPSARALSRSSFPD